MATRGDACMTTTRAGGFETWTSGDVTLYRGDCLEVLPTLAAGSVDAVVTDPPYKVSQMYGGGVDADNLVAVCSIFRSIGDIARIVKPGGFAVVCYDNRILPFLFESVKGTDLIYRKQVFLYRRWGLANRWVGWMQTTDPICIFVKGHDKPFSPSVKGKVKHDCYIKNGPEAVDGQHPAQKPLEMFLDFATWCSDDGGLIVDPYMGSGTTGVACVQLGRKFIGVEISEDYFRIAVKRISEAQAQLRIPFESMSESGDSSRKGAEGCQGSLPSL